MRRFFTIILAVFAIFPILLLSACGENNKKPVNMTRYFNSDVNYTVYGESGTKTSKLAHFIGSNPDQQNAYISVEFVGNNAWIYKLNVEKIEFDVFSNIDAEIQLNIHVSNLRNGDLDAYQDPKFKASFDCRAGKTQHVSIDVNDYFESNIAATKIVIEVDGAQHYFAENQETGLKIDIINFKVYGNHDNI